MIEGGGVFVERVRRLTSRAGIARGNKTIGKIDSPECNEYLKRSLDEASGVCEWVLHDLRRTARSLMSRAGVNSDHAERCLGHVLSGVRGVYDRHQYLNEMRHAFEALAAQIERIVSPVPNVVSLPARG